MVVVVEGGLFGPFVAENTTMIVIGLILSVLGVGYLCWLLFTLAVYALPLFAGMMAGLAAYHSGAGLGALVVGFAAGAVTLVAGQAAFAAVKSPVLRRDRHPIRGAGRHRRLPRNARPCQHRRAFGELAGSLCNRRCDCRRWNRIRSFGGEGRPPAAGHVVAVAPGQSRVMAVTRHG